MRVDVLDYIVKNEPNHIEDLAAGSGHDPSAAVGVAKLLIGNGGNETALSGRQRFYWEKHLKPLLYEVPCEGGMNDPDSDTCSGNGYVDDESLLLSYQEGEFVCQLCRFDREKM